MRRWPVPGVLGLPEARASASHSVEVAPPSRGATLTSSRRPFVCNRDPLPMTRG